MLYKSLGLCRQAILSPKNTFASVKRLIGRKYDLAKEQAQLVRLPIRLSYKT